MSEQERKINDAIFEASVSIQRARAILRLIVNEYFDSAPGELSMLILKRDYNDVAAALSVVQSLLYEVDKYIAEADS